MHFTLRRRNNANSLRGIEHSFAYWRHLFGLVTRACKREIQRYTVCSVVRTLFYFLCPKLVIKRIEHLSHSLHIKVNSGKYYVYAGTLHDSPIGKRYKRISVMYLPVTSLTIFLCNVELASKLVKVKVFALFFMKNLQKLSKASLFIQFINIVCRVFNRCSPRLLYFLSKNKDVSYQ